MSNKLTHQGVRNLNDPPVNARQISNKDICMHSWKHDPACTACEARYLPRAEELRCSEKCSKCGARR